MSATPTEPERLFSPAVAGWFRRSFAEPTPAQRQGWPPIARGDHTLLLAPTGSGKTLAAFLAAIDRLAGQPAAGTRVLYVSPLRALNHDIEKNLRAPLAGIECDRQITVGLRTGDTSQAQRAALRRHPPDILITTPESLYLMLTSGARDTLRGVETVIVDEIHAMAGGKRGVHLALSLERLDHLCGRHVQRVGLSATQRPLAEVASYLGGAGREVTVVDAGSRKPLDLEVVVPVPDMRELGGLPTVEGEPRQSIWPAIYPRLLELVQAHRSTLVFVNNRRAAERIANRLNALAGEDVARAHHGSIAREQRLEIEELLKNGSLPALVATSSLELGIDMGAIDLVVQIESPKSVAAGLQRVGRAGHQVGEPSVGRFFPKFRGDLLETAVVTRRMREGEIEHTRVPRQPLDVLAQQIVACVVMDDWDVGELHELMRGAHSYRELSREQFEGVLDMLAGRYPSDEFAELRPRLVWDRTAGRLRARSGSRRLAVTSSGTIPDRGLYGVFLADSGARVGELDEEMVYEARQGEVFQLGASSWRIEQITRDRVLVSPAPGVPGKIPFWKGDAVGRPYELGRAVGEAARTRRFGDLDELAAANLHAYLDDQEAATGVVPSDRHVVVERFRDEIGDWRVCVLSPFGGRVHAPWAIAVEARMSEALGLEVEATWSDDGIAIRLPDTDTPPPTDLIAVPPDELDDLLVSRVAQSPLFAGRFRENAARALLLPRRRPGVRMPLWQQRLKAHDLQQVAIRFGSFPILLETYREVLSDVFEVPRLKELLEQIARGSVRLVELETPHPSPFASSLLFDYIAGFMYEGDAPAAERRMQALSLDRALLAELLAADEVRELLDADAIDQVEQELQGIGGELDADRTHDLLRRLGDLSEPELAARGAAGLDQLLAERRAVEVGIAGDRRLIAAEDAALYRDALGAVPPQGLPAAFLQPVEGALERLVGRYGRTHGPFTADRLRTRFGVDATPAVTALVERGELLEGGFLPGGSATELVAPDVLRRLRRRTMAVARRAVEPVDRETLGRFLPAWHGIGRDLGGRERLREAVSQLQGVPLPVAAIESDLLPARIRDYRDEWLDAACAGGEVVWIGAGRGRVRLYLREDAALLHQAEEPPAHPILDMLEARGASFFADLAAALDGGERTALTELWELVWAGQVTNDAWQPLRSGTTLRLLPAPAQGARPSRKLRAVASLPAARGRWSLVRRLLEPAPAPRERARALAETLLERQGVVTRQGVLAEGVPGGFSAAYGELRLMEEAGTCRRGYFVEGLGGAQFGLAAAVERLRDVRERSDRPAAIVLSAIDPANPYGAAVPWPEAPRKLARVAGAWVVLVDGRLGLVVERGGRGLVTFEDELLEPAIASLADAVRGRRIRRLAPERVNGERLAGGEVERLLLAHGFLPGHRRLVLRA